MNKTTLSLILLLGLNTAVYAETTPKQVINTYTHSFFDDLGNKNWDSAVVENGQLIEYGKLFKNSFNRFLMDSANIPDEVPILSIKMPHKEEERNFCLIGYNPPYEHILTDWLKTIEGEPYNFSREKTYEFVAYHEGTHCYEQGLEDDEKDLKKTSYITVWERLGDKELHSKIDIDTDEKFSMEVFWYETLADLNAILYFQKQNPHMSKEIIWDAIIHMRNDPIIDGDHRTGEFLSFAKQQFINLTDSSEQQYQKASEFRHLYFQKMADNHTLETFIKTQFKR